MAHCVISLELDRFYQHLPAFESSLDLWPMCRPVQGSKIETGTNFRSFFSRCTRAVLCKLTDSRLLYAHLFPRFPGKRAESGAVAARFAITFESKFGDTLTPLRRSVNSRSVRLSVAEGESGILQANKHQFSRAGLLRYVFGRRSQCAAASVNGTQTRHKNASERKVATHFSPRSASLHMTSFAHVAVARSCQETCMASMASIARCLIGMQFCAERGACPACRARNIIGSIVQCTVQYATDLLSIICFE